MQPLEMVCLCGSYDLKSSFGPAFDRFPDIRLLRPQEVDDPASIRHAMAFKPGAAAFDPYPNLELVCSVGAGVDALVVHPGLKPDVTVSRLMLETQAHAIAGLAAWMVIGWTRRLWDYADLQGRREWNADYLVQPSEVPVGILGYGAIGRVVGEALLALGFPVLGYAGTARQVGPVDVQSGPAALVEIAAKSRALINLLPLTEATRGILSADLFARMPPDSILVNLGRGEHLVEADLLAALDQGRPGYAALDVFAPEPLPEDHPFWAHPKIRITPHVAGEGNFFEVSDWIAAAVRQFEAGEPPQGLVDRTKGY
ncbi:MAG: NAD(P)-dependent oxidoreductase [Pseudomonadota bacterium]